MIERGKRVSEREMGGGVVITTWYPHCLKIFSRSLLVNGSRQLNLPAAIINSAFCQCRLLLSLPVENECCAHARFVHGLILVSSPYT